MRLLTWNNCGQLHLTEDVVENIPPYAILSHTWGADKDEVIFADIGKDQALDKAGFAKILFCAKQARKDGFEHFWVDTCCINKDSHVELSEAIASMFRWYQKAGKCYVYLSDVSSSESAPGTDVRYTCLSKFRTSRWFTRGWTLQELLAPSVVEFFSFEGQSLGTKQTLLQEIHEVTTIPLAALQGTPLSQFPVTERLRWSKQRQTKKREDMAYCLLGIFDVFMPLIYGEGDNAIRRLQKEINEQFNTEVPTQARGITNRKALGLCLGSAPFISEDEFVGRTAELDQMAKVLQPGEPAVEQRRLMLGGIGGMGKTQLAIAYARRYQAKYNSIFWLNATSKETLKASLKSMAQLMLLEHALREQDEESTIQAGLRWLSDVESKPWLLICDNYDDPSSYTIWDHLPTTANGSILITTRVPDLLQGQHVQQLRLPPIRDVEESMKILRIRSQREDIDDFDVQSLAVRLSGLPLALATAGCYLRKTTLTFGQYLEAYEKRFDINPRRPVQLQEYTNRTLYTTWNMSYNQIQEDDPYAAKMLELLAYFDHQYLWFELLHAGLKDRSPEWLHKMFGEYVDFENVMATLVDYCILEVQATTTTRSYSIHKYVHDWALAELNKTIRPQLYWYAVDCVANSIEPGGILENLQYAKLSYHSVQLTHPRFEEALQADDISSEQLIAISRIGDLLLRQTQLPSAEKLYTRSLAGQEKALGPYHLTTLDAVSNVGILCYSQGKLEEAERMFQRALFGQQKVFNLDHHSILSIKFSLSVVYIAQGNLSKAEPILERVLDAREATLGPDHTMTLRAVNELASLYANQNKLKEAEQMFQRALSNRECVLGIDHIDTLDTVHRLGFVYYRQRNFQAAEEMYQRALAGEEKALGLDHHNTLDIVCNLGLLYFSQRKYEKAEQMYQRALAGKEKRPGPKHSSTLEIVVHLSQIFVKRTRLAKNNLEAASHLLGMIQLLGRWNRLQDPYFLYLLTKALVIIRDDENAQVAIIALMKTKKILPLDFVGIHCDRCQHEITLATGRHICRQCEDFDLCNACMLEYMNQELTISDCSGHDFFDVGSKVLDKIRSSEAYQDIDLNSWIEGVAQLHGPVG